MSVDSLTSGSGASPGTVPGLRRGPSWRSLLWAGACFLFFLLFFLYVWLRVAPAGLYHCRYMEFPPFSLGAVFVKEFLAYAGGPIEYVSAFLSQLFYLSWAGALIITAVAALLCVAAYASFTAFGGTRLPVLYFIPALPVLMLYSRYSHAMTLVLAVLASVLCMVLYASLPLRRPVLRAGAFLVLSCALWYVASGAYVIFVVLCGALELLTRRRVLLGLACVLLSLVAPPVAGTYLLPITIEDAYVGGMRSMIGPHTGDLAALIAVVCLLAFFPIVGVGVALWHRLGRRGAGVAGSAASTPERPRQPGLMHVLVSSAVVAAGLVVVYSFFDRDLGTLCRMECLSRRGTWERVLREARRLSPACARGELATWNVNWALYHTGRLPYEMFSYPQHAYSLIGTSEYYRRFNWRVPTYGKCADVCFELGLVNTSEQMSHEALWVAGDYGPTLLQLARIYILKGQPEASRMFLTAVSKDLVYGSAGRRYLELLKSDPELSTDQEVQRVRSLMMHTDLPHSSFEGRLLELLRTNRQNRMAFEYLMAVYLLTGQIEKLAMNMERLDDFAYPDVPRHYEEALLLHTAMTGRAADLGARRISPQTMARFQHVNRVLADCRGNRAAALGVLARQHGDTYFFYYLLHFASAPARGTSG